MDLTSVHRRASAKSPIARVFDIVEAQASQYCSCEVPQRLARFGMTAITIYEFRDPFATSAFASLTLKRRFSIAVY
jgi:hypothetical protein